MQGRCGEQGTPPPMTQAAEGRKSYRQSLFDKLGPAGTVFLRVDCGALVLTILPLARGAQVLECKRVGVLLSLEAAIAAVLCYPG